MQRVFVAAAALAAIGFALWQIAGTTDGLAVERDWIGATPITLYRPEVARPSPVVIIAHGFAGSQQLMQPFAVTLARNGYVAVTFDWPGHGRHPEPLPGGLAARDARSAALLAILHEVVMAVRARAYADGRAGLIGHSMASDIVVQYARAHPDIEATVAVSLFLTAPVARDSPRNLLVLDGALEPEALREAGARAVAGDGGKPAEPGMSYGRFEDGTARRFALAAGAEHIGVLYARDSMTETLAWMNSAFGREQASYLDSRGRLLALLYLGLVALAWPLARLLPRVATQPLGGGLGWRRLLPVAIAPAVLTPLVLWPLPTAFLPILLGDYLAAHFALYGALTACGLWIVSRKRPAAGATTLHGSFVIAAIAFAAYGIVALGGPTDRYAISFLPTGIRLPLVLALFAATLPYFAADEWLTRGPGAPRGAYALTKILFLVALALAIALNLQRLFFLIIIVPAILAFFVVFGLFSRWAYGRTWHPGVAAAGNAAVFAWAIAVTFPVVDR